MGQYTTSCFKIISPSSTLMFPLPLFLFLYLFSLFPSFIQTALISSDNNAPCASSGFCNFYDSDTWVHKIVPGVDDDVYINAISPLIVLLGLLFIYLFIS